MTYGDTYSSSFSSFFVAMYDSNQVDTTKKDTERKRGALE
jgi:hypothetical protein